MKRRSFIRTTALATLGGMMTPGSTASASEIFIGFSGEKELVKHKITDIKFFTTYIKYPRNVGRNAVRDNHGTGNTTEACLLKTDQGAEAWGLMEGKKEDYVKLSAKMTGKRVSELFTVNTGMLAPENSGYEIAFFDLAGMILNKPVFQLLGAKKPVVNKIYSGMIYFDDLDPKENPRGIDQLLKECEYDYKVGYRQFKLKIGRGNKWMEQSAGNQRDIEVTREIRKAFPDCEILVDANNGYSPDGFINYLNAIGPERLFWVEEPFDETLADCRKLREWMKSNGFGNVLYAEGEYAPNFELMQQLTDEKLIDVVLYDIIGFGFAAWRKLLPEIGRMNVLASPHAWGSGIKSNYIIHQSAAFGNTTTIEGVTSTSDDVDLSQYKIVNGKIAPPDISGFGMKLLKKL